MVFGFVLCALCFVLCAWVAILGGPTMLILSFSSVIMM